jgi:UDP-N-acetyl-D-glucosamine dehydrogenase
LVKKLLNVCVQGLGYVGSATCAALSKATNKNNYALYNVIGVDLNTNEGMKRINSLKDGKFPFKTNDKELVEELYKAKKDKRISATHDTTIYSKADIIVVNIPLDINYSSSEPKVNFKNFDDAIDTIGKYMNVDCLVLIETTVPPGTCEKRVIPILLNNFTERGLNHQNLKVAYSYERVTPGNNYLNSIINSWRVFSGYNESSIKACKIFLESFINTKKYPLTKLESLTSAETAKVMENSYRAINIAFIEEWSKFAENIGINSFEMIEAIKKRPTHNNIMFPGFGVGGYCLTKDPLFAGLASKQLFNISNQAFPICELGVKINQKMPLNNLNRLKNYMGTFKNKKILLLGVAYKSDVDDARHSPSEIFYNEAIKYGAIVDVHDPYISIWENLEIKVLKNIPEAKNYDAIVLAVNHKYYLKFNFISWLKNSNSIFMDTFNIFSANEHKKFIKNKQKIIVTGRGDIG